MSERSPIGIKPKPSETLNAVIRGKLFGHEGRINPEIAELLNGVKTDPNNPNSPTLLDKALRLIEKLSTFPSRRELERFERAIQAHPELQRVIQKLGQPPPPPQKQNPPFSRREKLLRGRIPGMGASGYLGNSHYLREREEHGVRLVGPGKHSGINELQRKQKQ